MGMVRRITLTKDVEDGLRAAPRGARRTDRARARGGRRRRVGGRERDETVVPVRGGVGSVAIGGSGGVPRAVASEGRRASTRRVRSGVWREIDLKAFMCEKT